MTIGVVIPLKAKQVSKDWAETQKRLQATIRSLIRQTYQEFHVYLACHDVPELEMPDGSMITYISAKFEPPMSRNYPRMAWDFKEKMRIGVEAAIADDVQWILKIDADDLLANEILSFIDGCRQDVVILNKGIVYSPGSAWFVKEEKNFHKICGSTVAVRGGFIRSVPRNERGEMLNDFFASNTTDRAVAHCQKYRKEPAFPPFLAVCYIHYHSSRPVDNLSQYRAKERGYQASWRELAGRLRRTRPMTNRVRSLFGL